MNGKKLEPLNKVNIEAKYENHMEKFQPEVVDEFRDSDNFGEKYDYNLRHYSQTAIDLPLEKVQELFSELSIDPDGKTVTVFGGYTGEFAERLRQLGCNVIFTDPIEQFVEKARKKGFESYVYFAEEIPGEIVKRSDFFATFECYFPLGNGMESVYTSLRFLSTRYGLVFGESKRTRKEVDEGSRRPVGRMKTAFKPFNKVYSTNRRYRGRKLRLYHMFQPEQKNREKIVTDCRAIKFLHDFFEKAKIEIDSETVKELSINTEMSVEGWKESLKRILEVNHWNTDRSLRRVGPYNSFNILSKRFKIKLRGIEKVSR